MINDPPSLANGSGCYVCFGVSMTEGMVLGLLAQIVEGGGPTPTPGATRITEEGNRRVTESGNVRITE